MASIRVEVNKRVLSWALERAKVGTDLQRKFPRLSDWLTGAAQPTLRQLEEFAKATSVPFGYLLLPEPPQERLPIPHFRTLVGVSAEHFSADLLDTVQIMQRRQAWMREYFIEQGHEPLPFVRSASPRTDPRVVAQQIRGTLGLNADWASRQPNWTVALRVLQEKAEDAGIVVVVSGIVGNNARRKLNVEEFRGFVLVDEYAPLVFINGADGKAAQMFTLAHELAHVWLGKSASFDLRDLQPAPDETEQACNHIAAEFLVPADSLREYLPSARLDPDPFQAIARRFKVSEIVAARRLLDLDLISREKFFDFYQEYQARERRQAGRQAGGDFYATQSLRLGRRFGEAVVRATKEGRLLYDEAYRLTGLYGKTFERFAEFILGMRK
ncbi:MAG: ImmA/IrrE family metallo-endopeptidase [Phage 5P_2]|nr:MAG: ImmA/IrrE family metallo-endopeptidase [Phage 5P_2]